ncbi:gp53 [Brochothrix phage A9]|uniref:Gp53 n=1 Tax=Brochothrix phage A9 TaxID=857312 RepID=D9J0K0_9CAUD|nr:gp53 [Brochothrix phage A9]ADJ53093.1 gp53 [Brochothrix phage A9]
MKITTNGVAMLLMSVLVVLKLMGFVDISWWVVLIPAILPILMCVTVLVVFTVAVVVGADDFIIDLLKKNKR